MTDRHLLASWLAHVERLDLNGLLQLYHPDAVVEWLRDRWEGRDEIHDALADHGRHLRKFRLDGVSPVVEAEGRILFDTRVSGPLGTRRVRHEWALDGGAIRRHTATLT